MAERLNRRHQDMVRQKIKASQLANRLQDHVFGKIELSQTQVSAANILLKKCIADLTSTTVANPDGSNLNFVLMVPPKSG